MTDPVHPDQPYTPSEEQAGRAYVAGMRQAFIASAGEHAEEWDRFIVAVRRDAQAEQRERDADGPDRKVLMIELVRLNERSSDIGDMSDGLIAYFAASIRSHSPLTDLTHDPSRSPHPEPPTEPV